MSFTYGESVDSEELWLLSQAFVDLPAIQGHGHDKYSEYKLEPEEAARPKHTGDGVCQLR